MKRQLSAWTFAMAALVLAGAGCRGAEEAQGSADDIYQAAAGGNVSALREFIGAGVDVNAPDAQGLTPLHHAVTADSPEAVRTLVEGGADPNARDARGLTPMALAVRSGKERAEETLDRLGARE